jgi:C1A family cysteine protease
LLNPPVILIRGKMSSISIETYNENKLTVQEYVRYIKIKEKIQEFLDRENVKDMLRESEGSINSLTIDLIVKFSINK